MSSRFWPFADTQFTRLKRTKKGQALVEGHPGSRKVPQTNGKLTNTRYIKEHYYDEGYKDYHRDANDEL
jgi:hypothetical protein